MASRNMALCSTAKIINVNKVDLKSNFSHNKRKGVFLWENPRLDY